MRAEFAVIPIFAVTLSVADLANAQDRDCKPAGSGIRIEATRTGGATFQVINRRHDTITRIHMGTSAVIKLTPEEMPRIATTPPGWRGEVVRNADSGDVHVVWEAIDPASGLPHGSKTDFGLLVRATYVMRPGERDADGKLIPQLDYRSLPFTARMVSGACWSGRTVNPWLTPEGGIAGVTQAGVARVITSQQNKPLLVDDLMGESQIRLSKDPSVFLAIPCALTFGVDGGFSADMSIGIGLLWKPTPHVNVSAKRTFGTFFFNNRTHLRTFGIDVAIPIDRSPLYEGVLRDRRQLVVGVEVFQRDVVKWAGFLDGPEWYASGTGFAIRAGIRNLIFSGP